MSGLIDDDRNDAERAYFESGGEKTEGLTVDTPAVADPQPGSKPSEAEPQADAGAGDAGTKPPVVADPGADDDDAPHDPAKPEPATVPYQKFRRTEKKYKGQLDALTKELTDFREKFARGDERLKLLTEALTPQQQAVEAAAQDEDPRPDPQADIFAYVAWQDRRAERLEKQLTDTATQSRGYIEEQQLVSTYRADANQFATTNKDFGNAYQFLLADRDRELTEMGYSDPNQRLQIITNEERELVTRNLQAKKSPAQAIYSLAKGRGYKGAAPAPAGGQPTPAAPGAAPAGAAAQAPGSIAAAPAAPAAAAAPASTVTAEIDRIRAGQDASKSLSSAGGAPNAPFSLQSLADLSDDDFAAMTAKHGGLEKLMKMAAA